MGSHSYQAAPISNNSKGNWYLKLESLLSISSNKETSRGNMHHSRPGANNAPIYFYYWWLHFFPCELRKADYTNTFHSMKRLLLSLCSI